MSELRPPLFPVRHALLCVCAVCFVGAATATHVPPKDVPDVGTSDTMLHLVGFFVLTSTFVLTLAGRVFTRRRVALTGLVMPVYAALDEITQPFFNRTADLKDWAADMAGAVAAILVCELIVLPAIQRLRR